MRRTTLPSGGRRRVAGTARRAVATAVAVTMIGGGVAACGKEGPGDTLAAFLAGWKSGDFAKVGFVTADGSPIAASKVTDEIAALSGDMPQASLVVTAVGEPKVTGEIASNPIKLDWTLPGGAPWSYQSTVRMTERGSDGWRVVWEPAVVHSELTSGDRLELRRVRAKRAGVLDAGGTAIVQPRPVVTVALDPQRVTDVPALTKALTKAFKKIKVSLDLSDLKERLAKAGAARVDLVTLRREDYVKIRDEVRPLEGTTFPEENRDLAPTRTFARALLGTVDPATREDIDASPELIAQNDLVGHGGLQQRYDTRLRGTPGQSVVIARKAPDDEKVDAGQLFSIQPVPGAPVKLTLDVGVQKAADAAVAAEKQPSALVAVRISDSAVLAAANGPEAATVDAALAGQVPPGSTFKMVSTLGLLQKKAVTPDTVVDCPKTKTVAGRSFKNSHDMVLGKVPFRTDFAKSCNTAFVELAPKLGADGLQAAGAALGLGGAWDLGAQAFSGKVSPGDSPTELAAASFGQGRTVVSPLAMASATAAVARGKFQQPRLVLDPAPAKPAADGAAIDPAVVEPLRAMMREVVTKGTGAALRRVPGDPVYGKTGTAEFQDDSAETHAWFIGWQGDVAFAVMVQKGGAGADTAVPIVSRFLTSLNK